MGSLIWVQINYLWIENSIIICSGFFDSHLSPSPAKSYWIMHVVVTITYGQPFMHGNILENGSLAQPNK